RAIRRGNLAEVKRFLDEGNDIEAVGGRFHGTLLLESCRYHSAKVTDLLLERGASVNVSGGGFWTPLHYACDAKEDPALVTTLLRHRAEVDAIDFHGRSPLHIASKRGSSRVVLALLNAGADPNAPDEDGRTPVHDAASNGRRVVIATLVDFGGRLTAVDQELDTPLHRATREGQRVAMSLLRIAGADPDAVNCWGDLAGTLAPSYKMNPRSHPEVGDTATAGLGAGCCVACSAKRGRHYYFCRSEVLKDVPDHFILGPDGLPMAAKGEEPG
ncbi:unnamed protein product, partial [Laminaria digitata]